jgi:hypothetical protein
MVTLKILFFTFLFLGFIIAAAAHYSAQTKFSKQIKNQENLSLVSFDSC